MGYTATELREAEFTSAEVKEAGFTAQERNSSSGSPTNGHRHADIDGLDSKRPFRSRRLSSEIGFPLPFLCAK